MNNTDRVFLSLMAVNVPGMIGGLLFSKICFFAGSIVCSCYAIQKIMSDEESYEESETVD